jgi:hypothetical protein
MAEPILIEIANCEAYPKSKKVQRWDVVVFSSRDNKTYKLTGLGKVFQGAPGQIDVPAVSPVPPIGHIVVGKKDTYKYKIHGVDFVCPKKGRGTPEIIIDP